MSQNSGTQVQQTVETTEASASATTTATVATKQKREKLTEKILACLRTLPAGKFATIGKVQSAVLGIPEEELKAKVPANKLNVIQSTVSQMVAKGKVYKEKTGARMPGYCLPAAKTATTTSST